MTNGFVVLDTDVASLSFKRQLPPTLLAQLVGTDVCITFVTLGELTKWAELRRWGKRNRDALQRSLDRALLLPFDRVATVTTDKAGPCLRVLDELVAGGDDGARGPAPGGVRLLRAGPGLGWEDRLVGMRLLLRGGLVADGVGPVPVPAEVLVEGGVIVAVGREVGGGVDAERVELPAGSVVCPGFVDAHVHAEGPLVADGVVVGALAQGVTTLVVGQDGSSWIGASAAAAAYLGGYFGPVNGAAPPEGCRVADFGRLVAGRLAQNAAVLASHGTIRYRFAGLGDRSLDGAELVAARGEVDRALAAGAVGLSSGLDYLPSRFGTAGEIAALAAPLAGSGRPYVSHLRGYGARVGAGLAELVRVGRLAGVPVHASHLWGPPEQIHTALAAATAAGVPVSFDMYPYRRSATILAMLLLPADLQAGGRSATLAALADPAVRGRLAGTGPLSDDHLARVVLAAVPDRWASAAGMTVTAAAHAAGRPAADWVLDLLTDAGLQVGAQLDRPELTDTDLHWILTHDRHAAGSDGIYQGQHPHPRGYGTFARLAGHYTDRTGRTDYQQLVRHLAANPAEAYRLHTRGRIAPGMAADICVLDPSGLTDQASYQHPRRPASGVRLVLVNGVPVWTPTGATTARPGQVITR